MSKHLLSARLSISMLRRKALFANKILPKDSSKCTLRVVNFILRGAHCTATGLGVSKLGECRLCMSKGGRRKARLTLRPTARSMIVGCLSRTKGASSLGIDISASRRKDVSLGRSGGGLCALTSILRKAHFTKMKLSPSNECLVTGCHAACMNNQSTNDAHVARLTDNGILTRHARGVR